ncbi:hypothetical protein ACFLXV_00710 [Chloroflexota bacterium]
MRFWHKISFAGLLLLILLSGTSTALAQEGNGIVPALRDVLLNVAGRVDDKLGTWVSGNTLTDPEGTAFIADLAEFIRALVAYIAESLEDLLIWMNYL